MVDDGLPWFQDLWDTTDLQRSADRFREALPHQTDPDRIAQLTSQLARTRCLFEDYDGALALLDAIDTKGLSPVTRARLMMERGRVLNDTHTADRGVALFEQVWAMTVEAGADDLAADAAHMLAWIGEDPVGWTQRGLDLVERSPLEGPRRWIPTLRANLGNLLRREGRLAEAQACYGALVAWAGPCDVHRRWGEVGLANVLREQGRIDEALSIVARLADEHPNDDRLGGFIAECHGLCLVASGADGSAVLARAYRLLEDDVFLRRSEPERLEALRAALAEGASPPHDEARPLHELGLTPEDLETYVAVLRAGRGLVVHCGPPGSGKRTTHHAALGALAREDLVVFSIEQAPGPASRGVHQIVLDPSAGLDLEVALTAAMRQDPDVIGVSPPPDPQTAQSLLDASMGNWPLVLTMMEDADPSAALRRLTGLDPLFADTVQLVVAHRRTPGRPDLAPVLQLLRIEHFNTLELALDLAEERRD